jgi:hypothetical protein
MKDDTRDLQIAEILARSHVEPIEPSDDCVGTETLGSIIIPDYGWEQWGFQPHGHAVADYDHLADLVAYAALHGYEYDYGIVIDDPEAEAADGTRIVMLSDLGDIAKAGR